MSIIMDFLLLLLLKEVGSASLRESPLPHNTSVD